MKTQTNVGAWIGTLVMGVVAFGVLTAEEGDMLMRAVATAATAIVGAALIVAEAWKRKGTPPPAPLSPLELATRFHEFYETLAPQFGYETRPETKKFNPDSANGRLMVAVSEKILGLVNLASPSDLGVTEIVLEGVTFDLSPENLQELGQIAYQAYGDLCKWEASDGKPMPAWTEVHERVKPVWVVVAEAVATKLEEALLEGGGATDVEDILRAFPTRDLVQALTQRVGVERRNLPLESEDGPAILLKIVD